MFQTELQSCKCIIQIRWHIDYVEPWAHRYCDDTRTISEHHIYTWLVPVLIIPRSCSIVVVPDFSSLPLWCILWYMVLRKYCTSDSRLCYIFYFIRWWFILNLWSTHWRQHTVYDQITCMRCEFWLCCHQCTWWLSWSSMHSVRFKNKRFC